MQLALWNDAEPSDDSGIHTLPRRRRTAVPQASREAVPLATVGRAKLAKARERLEERAEQYVQDAHAENTRRAYRKDWAAFATWCTRAGKEALPATSHTLELYLTHLAQRGPRVSTIRRARIAIGLAHGHAELPRPDHHARIRTLERGIGRTHGSHEEGAPPLLEHELAQAVKALGASPRDERESARMIQSSASTPRSWRWWCSWCSRTGSCRG
jgi:hypothetical protein